MNHEWGRKAKYQGILFYLPNYTVLPGLLWCDLLLINRLILKLFHRGSQGKRPPLPSVLPSSQESIQSCSHLMLFRLILAYCILSYLISPLLISSFSNFSHTPRNRKKSSFVLSLQVILPFISEKHGLCLEVRGIFSPNSGLDKFYKLSPGLWYAERGYKGI